MVFQVASEGKGWLHEKMKGRNNHALAMAEKQPKA